MGLLIWQSFQRGLEKFESPLKVITTIFQGDEWTRSETYFPCQWTHTAGRWPEPPNSTLDAYMVVSKAALHSTVQYFRHSASLWLEGQRTGGHTGDCTDLHGSRTAPVSPRPYAPQFDVLSCTRLLIRSVIWLKIMSWWSYGCGLTDLLFMQLVCQMGNW